MRYLFTFTLFLAGSVSCFATPGQASTPAPGAFVGVCAGLGNSGVPWPGDMPNFGSCDSQTVSGSATASTSISNAGSGWSNSASGWAKQGQIHVFATNTGSASNYFPGAVASGGWDDMLTLTGGTGTGIWAATITVQNSSLTSLNNGASASAGIRALVNKNPLQPYGAAVNGVAYNKFNANNTTHNGVVYSSWDSQYVQWSSTNWGPTDPETMNGLSVPFTQVTFYIPFTYGVAFDVGFYMVAQAGERASGGGTTVNTATSDFSHSAYWGGKGVVFDSTGANPTSNFSVSSGSGFDYSTAVTPEPGSWALSGVGLAAALLVVRRRSA